MRESKNSSSFRRPTAIEIQQKQRITSNIGAERVSSALLTLNPIQSTISAGSNLKSGHSGSPIPLQIPLNAQPRGVDLGGMPLGLYSGSKPSSCLLERFSLKNIVGRLQPEKLLDLPWKSEIIECPARHHSSSQLNRISDRPYHQGCPKE